MNKKVDLTAKKFVLSVKLLNLLNVIILYYSIFNTKHTYKNHSLFFVKREADIYLLIGLVEYFNISACFEGRNFSCEWLYYGAYIRYMPSVPQRLTVSVFFMLTLNSVV